MAVSFNLLLNRLIPSIEAHTSGTTSLRPRPHPTYRGSLRARPRAIGSLGKFSGSFVDTSTTRTTRWLPRRRPSHDAVIPRIGGPPASRRRRGPDTDARLLARRSRRPSARGVLAMRRLHPRSSGCPVYPFKSVQLAG